MVRARTVGSRPGPPPPPKRRESLRASASNGGGPVDGAPQNPFLAGGGGSIVGYAPTRHVSNPRFESGAGLARVPSAPSAVTLASSVHSATSPSLNRHSSLSRSSSARTNNAKQLGQDLSLLLEKGGKTGHGWLAKAAERLPGVVGGGAGGAAADDDPGLAMRRRRREERERLVEGERSGNGGGAVGVGSDEDGDGDELVEDEGFEVRDERRRERAEAERRVAGSGVVGEGEWVPL